MLDLCQQCSDVSSEHALFWWPMEGEWAGISECGPITWKFYWLYVQICSFWHKTNILAFNFHPTCLFTHTHTHNHFTALWIYVRDNPGEPVPEKHSPTRGHQSSLICFIHLTISVSIYTQQKFVLGPNLWLGVNHHLVLPLEPLLALNPQHLEPIYYKSETPDACRTIDCKLWHPEESQQSWTRERV